MNDLFLYESIIAFKLIFGDKNLLYACTDNG